MYGWRTALVTSCPDADGGELEPLRLPGATAKLATRSGRTVRIAGSYLGTVFMSRSATKSRFGPEHCCASGSFGSPFHPGRGVHVPRRAYLSLNVL